MIITLYNSHDANEVMDKSLTKIADVTAEPYDPIDILSPFFVLSDESVSALKNVNYCYVPEFERYYNASITLTNNGIYILQCNECDVLMSFKNDILNLPVIVDKQQYDANPYINDGSFVVEEREAVQVVNYANGFNDSGRYILIVSGG